jgi:hypothetical protein
MNTEEQIFWTFFITSMMGLILGLSKIAYKSKCKEVEFCCIRVVRDTEAEEREIEFTGTHSIGSDKEEKV